jgi:hypothetical protein
MCGDRVPQHYREFDQKLAGGGGFRHAHWFLLRQTFVEGFVSDSIVSNHAALTEASIPMIARSSKLS